VQGVRHLLLFLKEKLKEEFNKRGERNVTMVGWKKKMYYLTWPEPPPTGSYYSDEASLVFINLEDNLLSSFDDAFSIAVRCPRLAALRLGKNRLEPPANAPLHRGFTAAVKTLFVGRKSWKKETKE